MYFCCSFLCIAKHRCWPNNIIIKRKKLFSYFVLLLLLFFLCELERLQSEFLCRITISAYMKEKNKRNQLKIKRKRYLLFFSFAGQIRRIFAYLPYANRLFLCMCFFFLLFNSQCVFSFLFNIIIWIEDIKKMNWKEQCFGNGNCTNVSCGV